VKQLLALLVVAAIALGGVGWYRGWFTVEKNPEGKGRPEITVNKGKIEEDKEAVKKVWAEKTKALKERLAALRDKSKDLKGEKKAKADKEIDELTKEHDALDKEQEEGQKGQAAASPTK
jgi:hypothetical protein